VSVVGVLLIGLGLTDLARSEIRRASRARLVLAVALGVVAMGALAGLGGLTRTGDLVLLVLGATVLAGWAVLSDRAMPSGRATPPLTALAVGISGLLVLSGLASHAGGALHTWQVWAAVPGVAHLSTDRLLLVAGVFVVQFSTANFVVRLVLASVGAIKPLGQPQASDRLRGGRLLGPMERVFIVGLGLAGEFTAAGIVIAAKGLIRWPELQARTRETGTSSTPGTSASAVGIDEITEYFLVGSFVSWLVALATLGLVAAG
jgi:hypothetical protein